MFKAGEGSFHDIPPDFLKILPLVHNDSIILFRRIFETIESATQTGFIGNDILIPCFHVHAHLPTQMVNPSDNVVDLYPCTFDQSAYMVGEIPAVSENKRLLACVIYSNCLLGGKQCF